MKHYLPCIRHGLTSKFFGLYLSISPQSSYNSCSRLLQYSSLTRTAPKTLLRTVLSYAASTFSYRFVIVYASAPYNSDRNDQRLIAHNFCMSRERSASTYLSYRSQSSTCQHQGATRLRLLELFTLVPKTQGIFVCGLQSSGSILQLDKFIKPKTPKKPITKFSFLDYHRQKQCCFRHHRTNSTINDVT